VKWVSSVSKNAAVSVIKIYHCLIRDDADIKKKATLNIQLTFVHSHSYKILAHFWGLRYENIKKYTYYLLHVRLSYVRVQNSKTA